MKLIQLHIRFIGTIFVATNFVFTACESKNKEKTRVFNAISLQDSVILDFPLIRFQEHYGKMYAYDYYNKSIVQVDKRFEVIDRLGSFGDGPKENLLVRNYEVLPSRLVAIFDVEKNTFKIQDFQDSVYLYQKFDFAIEGGVYLEDSSLFTVSIEDKSRLNFAKYSIEESQSQPIKVINDLFQEDHSALIYQGKILSNRDKLIFTSYFSSFWFVFDKNNSGVKFGSYLQDYQKPNVLEVGNMMMLEDAPELIYDSFISDNRIFIISNIGHVDYPDQRILDIYDLEFNYLKSYPLPNLNDTTPDEGFSVSGSNVAILYEDKLFFFKLN